MNDVPQVEDPWSVKIDVTKASEARLHDALLGGKDNYEADRRLVAQLLEVAPHGARAVVDQKRFLTRAVRFLAKEAGIDQFLDCGPGLPTEENTHQTAQRVNPNARAVYISNDPVVLAHGRALLENDQTHLVDADIFRPREVFGHRVVRHQLDLDRPLALLHSSTLQNYRGKRSPVDIMREYIDPLPSGSFVVITHLFDPETPELTALARKVERIMQNSSMGSVLLRTRVEIENLFVGLEIIEPGVTPCALWWPDGPELESLAPARFLIACGVGRKP